MPNELISQNKIEQKDLRFMAICVLEGYKPEQIADKMAAHIDTVQTGLNSQEFSLIMYSMLQDRLVRTAAPYAYSFLQQTLEDESVSKELRVKIARDLLDRAGFVPKKEIQNKDIPLAEMTRDALTVLLDQTRQELESLDKREGIIDITPEDTIPNDIPLNLLD